MLITPEIINRAEANKAKALDFIRVEEPILYDHLQRSIEESSKRIAELIRNGGAANPLRIAQVFVDSVKEISGLSYMAEAMARDVMESRKNPALTALVRMSNKDMAQTIDEATSCITPEVDPIEAAVNSTRGK